MLCAGAPGWDMRHAPPPPRDAREGRVTPRAMAVATAASAALPLRARTSWPTSAACGSSATTVPMLPVRAGAGAVPTRDVKPGMLEQAVSRSPEATEARRWNDTRPALREPRREIWFRRCATWRFSTIWSRVRQVRCSPFGRDLTFSLLSHNGNPSVVGEVLVASLCDSLSLMAADSYGAASSAIRSLL